MGVGWYLPLLICKGWQLILKQHRLFLTKGSLIRNRYDSNSKFCLNFLYVFNLFQPPLPLSELFHMQVRVPLCNYIFAHEGTCLWNNMQQGKIDEPAIDIYQNQSDHIVYQASANLEQLERCYERDRHLQLHYLELWKSLCYSCLCQSPANFKMFLRLLNTVYVQSPNLTDWQTEQIVYYIYQCYARLTNLLGRWWKLYREFKVSQ